MKECPKCEAVQGFVEEVTTGFYGEKIKVLKCLKCEAKFPLKWLRSWWNRRKWRKNEFVKVVPSRIMFTRPGTCAYLILRRCPNCNKVFVLAGTRCGSPISFKRKFSRDWICPECHYWAEIGAISAFPKYQLEEIEYWWRELKPNEDPDEVVRRILIERYGEEALI